MFGKFTRFEGGIIITKLNCEEDLILEIENHKSILIYGAGMIAELLAKRLISMGFLDKILCFMVSDKIGNPESLYDIPVHEINDIDYNEEENAVFVATLENNHPAIKKFLDGIGITNVFFISESLYRELRNKTVPEVKRNAAHKLRVSVMHSFLEETDTNILGLDENCDYLQKIFLNSACSYHEMSPEKFFYNYNNLRLDRYTVFCLSIPAEIEIREFINRLFKNADKIIISYRRFYINLPEFNLFSEAHKNGFILVGAKTFFRPREEYNADDILLCFKKAEPALLCKDILCTGCGACAKLCPHEALVMKADEQGYLRPFLKEEKCVSCNKCLHVCPVKKGNARKTENNPACYAVMASDEIRNESSSGGIFTLLAEECLNENGMVCGAAWNDSFGVEHVLIDDVKDLYKLRRSKYVQSDLKNVYCEIKEMLSKGRQVLFSGCPCQVAGLYSYLGKDYDNLFTIDLVCAQAPAQSLFKKYLGENFDIDKIEKYEFRRKEYGWRPDIACVTLVSGEKLFYTNEDSYQTAYHLRLMMPVHCEYCSFSGFPRQGDITIGDFWCIDNYDMTLDDKKGTSCVLLNSNKGYNLFKAVSGKLKLFKKVPLDWLKHNRINNSFYAHYNRDRFYSLIKSLPFNKAVDMSVNNKYDIGLVGNWSFPNYGSELTYYALNRVLTNMGYSVLMIEWPEDSKWKPYGATQLFAIEPYDKEEIAKGYPTKKKMTELNYMCEIFVLGSDQLMDNYLYWVFGSSFALDWVYSYKNKIGYALSFGRDEYHGSIYEQAELAHHLKRLNCISAREKSGVRIFKEKFGIDAEQVLDPVFLCDESEYKNLINKLHIITPVNYMFTYILDPDPVKTLILRQSAERLNLKLKAILDGEKDNIINDDFWNIDTVYNASIETWLAYIADCDFCITDSFHGVCFSIIFRKNFIAIVNNKRGATRFESLLSLLGLENRMVYKAEDIPERPELFNPIDYDKVYKILDDEREKSRHWLVDALKGKYNVELSDYDILTMRCDMLEEMIRKLSEKLK